jgi:hypothetical protein
VGQKWGKEDMRQKLNGLFPRLRERQGKYNFYLKKPGRSMELKFGNAGFVSGLIVSVSFYSFLDHFKNFDIFLFA